jgi:CxxC motif-containing protein
MFLGYRKSGKPQYWVQSAIRKKGSLSRQLGIPEEENIPKQLLQEIRKAKIGETVQNPTQTGNRVIKVTRLLKKRAVLALTLKSF